jgi:hypothetical protein
MGHIFAAPALFLFYFPFIYSASRKGIHKLSFFIKWGTLAAFLNGIPVVIFFSDGHFSEIWKFSKQSSAIWWALLLFPAAGFATSFLHCLILRHLAKKKPAWIGQKQQSK